VIQNQDKEINGTAIGLESNRIEVTCHQSELHDYTNTIAMPNVPYLLENIFVQRHVLLSRQKGFEVNPEDHKLHLS
jgi:hypothetical protein